jgi:class 3 adenylate cyclase
MTSTELACTACDTELPANSKFCNECGAAVTAHDTHAEYKQVTVLFADVVHSMDIAAAVGAERLREIIADSPTAVRRWCTGTAARSQGLFADFSGRPTTVVPGRSPGQGAVHSSSLSTGQVLTMRSTGTPASSARWAP